MSDLSDGASDTDEFNCTDVSEDDIDEANEDGEEEEDDALLWKVLQLSRASDMTLLVSPFEDEFASATLLEWRAVQQQLSDAAKRRGINNILSGGIRPIMKYFLSDLLFIMCEHVNRHLESSTVQAERRKSVTTKDIANYVRVELISAFCAKSPELLYKTGFAGLVHPIMPKVTYDLILRNLRKPDSESSAHEP